MCVCVYVVYWETFRWTVINLEIVYTEERGAYKLNKNLLRSVIGVMLADTNPRVRVYTV